MAEVIVAATQMRCRPDRDDNIAGAESLVKKAVAAGSTGQLLAEADRSTETIITAELDLERHKVDRNAWGLFRDRRPEMYQALMTLDGVADRHE